MSTVTVRMKVKPEKREDFLRILTEVTDAVEESEPDTVVYATWETETPNEFFMIESYRSQEGRDFHNEQHKAIAPEFFACLDGPPEVETLGALVRGAGKPAQG